MGRMIQARDHAAVGEQDAAAFFLLGEYRLPFRVVWVIVDIEYRIDGELFSVIGIDIQFDQVMTLGASGYLLDIPDIFIAVDDPITGFQAMNPVELRDQPEIAKVAGNQGVQ
ncbi:MAG: hypothetical protein LC633_08325 [Desulfobulbaceae bacterium]|nr:hypothetical protein [Desulfobulbaceae bacterium]